MERVAQDMKSEIDEKKEALRIVYRQKQQDFDRESDLTTQSELERIRKESKEHQEKRNKSMLAQYKEELDRLERVYHTRQDNIVEQILENIIKG